MLTALLTSLRRLWVRLTLPLRQLSGRIGPHSQAESEYYEANRDANQAYRSLRTAVTPAGRASVLEDLADAKSRMAVLALLLRPERFPRWDLADLAFTHALATRILKNAAATELALARGSHAAGMPAIEPLLAPQDGPHAWPEPRDHSLWLSLQAERDRGKRALCFERLAELLTSVIDGPVGAGAAETAHALARSELTAAAVLDELS